MHFRECFLVLGSQKNWVQKNSLLAIYLLTVIIVLAETARLLASSSHLTFLSNFPNVRLSTLQSASFLSFFSGFDNFLHLFTISSSQSVAGSIAAISGCSGGLSAEQLIIRRATTLKASSEM